MYFRVKRTGPYPYLQLVESFRDGGKVRQRVLSTLGRLDVLQASGQLDDLMRSGLRFCEKLAVIDAHAAGQTEAVTVKTGWTAFALWASVGGVGHRPGATEDFGGAAL